jgi:hypothetical protein
MTWFFVVWSVCHRFQEQAYTCHCCISYLYTKVDRVAEILDLKFRGQTTSWPAFSQKRGMKIDLGGHGEVLHIGLTFDYIYSSIADRNVLNCFVASEELV